MITNVNWCNERPKFEDVEGKNILIEYIGGNPKFPATQRINNVNKSDFTAHFYEGVEMKYAIIEDEIQTDKLEIAGIPVHIVYNGVPDNYPQWGFVSVADAEKVARIINKIVSSQFVKGE
jgi:hypothetical protein